MNDDKFIKWLRNEWEENYDPPPLPPHVIRYPPTQPQDIITARDVYERYLAEVKCLT